MGRSSMWRVDCGGQSRTVNAIHINVGYDTLKLQVPRRNNRGSLACLGQGNRGLTLPICRYYFQTVDKMVRVAGQLVRRALGQAIGASRGFSTSTAFRRIDKICPSAAEAIRDVKKRSILLVGGFGFSGVPSSLIDAIAQRQNITDLTIVSNNAGMPGVGLGM